MLENKIFFKHKKKKQHIISEKLGMWRRTKVTKGGRRFSLSSLVMIKNEENKSISFAYSSGKDSLTSFRKSIKKAQKKMINYFHNVPRTIKKDVKIKYKSTIILLKPASPGSGIKAGGVLNKLFKFIGIRDISAKIIGSKKNKMNIIRASFMALDEITGKKYDY